MKTLPVLLITTVLASASVLVACGDKDDHGHSHDDAAEHSHKQEDHGHDHATEQNHEEGDHKHVEGNKHEQVDDDHKHANEQDHHGDDHGHDHTDHAHHGGIVAMVDGVHHELVAADGKVSLYAEGLPKGEALQAVKARLTLLRGTEKQDTEMSLTEGDEPRFDADLQLQPGDKVVVQIQTGKAQTRLVRFDVPASE